MWGLLSAVPGVLEDSHGEFLRLLFFQAHCETAAHFAAAQQDCDSFKFRRRSDPVQVPVCHHCPRKRLG